VKVAEACGLRSVRITDPRKCRAGLNEALEMDGPVLVECVIDPHEPPMPPKITSTQAKHLAEALTRGEVNRTPIGLTIGHDALDESTFAASPMGVVGRLKKTLHIGERGGGHGDHRNKK
jgi:pyruvate dehydrogenase (quinone)/pyruvate oxidase